MIAVRRVEVGLTEVRRVEADFYSFLDLVLRPGATLLEAVVLSDSEFVVVQASTYPLRFKWNSVRRGRRSILD